MYKIDDYKYFFNQEDKERTKFINDVTIAIFKKYPSIKKNIEEHFKRYNFKYTETEKENLMRTIILSSVKEIQDNKMIFNTKDEYLKYIKKTLVKVLPLVLKNEINVSINSFFYYESANVFSLFLLNSYYSKIGKYASSNENKLISDNDYYIFLLNNLVRSLRSILILLETGDDVHGMGLFRGAIELLARYLSLNKTNLEEFKKFVNLNAQLQYYKANKIPVDKDSPDLLDLIVNKKLTGGALEMYLLNGWCKNRNGNRIKSNSDMIAHSLNSDFVDLYKLASEFVHEDYLFVNYDYMNIRLTFKYYVNIITFALFDEINYYIKLSKEDSQVYSFLEEYINSLPNKVIDIKKSL